MAKKFYTVGVAPFKGCPATLRTYISSSQLGDVARIDDGNQTPLLTPQQVERANAIYDEANRMRGIDSPARRRNRT